jgi:hypothetical protein
MGARLDTLFGKARHGETFEQFIARLIVVGLAVEERAAR